MPLITLTTDFGTDSPYVAEMKGVTLSLAPTATVVDLTHAIAPQDIRGAARIVARSTQYFSPRTIHVVVVDPGVGTERAILYAEIAGQCYLAPDNGVLGLLADRRGLTRAIRLDEPCYWRESVSNTFHGRDIFAPVAAHLANGLDPALLGPTVGKIESLLWPRPKCSAKEIVGQIVAIDSFGNVITNITTDELAFPTAPSGIEFTCGKISTSDLVRTYGESPPHSAVALVGSGGEWELAVVNGSAAGTYGLQIGNEVLVRRPLGSPEQSS